MGCECGAVIIVEAKLPSVICLGYKLNIDFRYLLMLSVAFEIAMPCGFHLIGKFVTGGASCLPCSGVPVGLPKDAQWFDSQPEAHGGFQERTQ